MIQPEEIPLPEGIRSRLISDVNGLDMHILEAGDPVCPCILLLHGFPELAYSWRHIMLPIAEAGFHVVAPDQRGYGWTTGWDKEYSSDLSPFRRFNLIQDLCELLHALKHQNVVTVVGHDYGSPVAAWASLLRPDIFQSVVLMSAPFSGATRLFNSGSADIHQALTELPKPKKHYQHYYTQSNANNDILNCAQGVHDFLRAYYHYKSADWKGNNPFPLTGWTAHELAKMPSYYIMDYEQTIAQAVEHFMPSEKEIAQCHWLDDTELEIYTSVYQHTSFQGGLNWYRVENSPHNVDEVLFSGKTIDVPSCFIAGKNDWGIYQSPGALEAMKERACTNMQEVHFIDNAGHWVQQEKPTEVTKLVLGFIAVQVN